MSRQRLPRVVPFLLMSIGPIMTILLLPVVLVLYAGFWGYEWARTRALGRKPPQTTQAM